jgi:RNA polymerase sigma-70 factor (ECF subfamily)
MAGTRQRPSPTRSTVPTVAEAITFDGGLVAFPLPKERSRPARRDAGRADHLHSGARAVTEDAGLGPDATSAEAASADAIVDEALAADGGVAARRAAPPADEEALIERARGGDARAFDELVRRYMARAFRIAYRLLGHREDAEDLVQDAFIRALEKLDTFERGRPFAPWFFRLLTNRGLNARKARALRQTSEVPDAAVAGGESPAESAERADLRERLRVALAALPPKQRMIVQMFEVEGRSSTEIAAALGMAEGTVRWHAHQARKVLRAALAPLQQSEER